MFRDVLDYPISVGAVHAILSDAVERARSYNHGQDLSAVRIGAHDEIFQSGRPVLVGADVDSTYCYLLSLEEGRDGDKRPFLKPVLATQSVVMGRLRKDAAVYDLPPKPKKGQRRGRGRPPTYGQHRISLAKRAGQPGGWQSVECRQYNKTVTKTVKSFLATYHPA